MHKHCSKICVYTDSILTKSLKRKHPTLVISILQKRKQVTCPGLHSRTEIWSQAVWLQSLVLLIHTISYSLSTLHHCQLHYFKVTFFLKSFNKIVISKVDFFCLFLCDHFLNIQHQGQTFRCLSLPVYRVQYPCPFRVWQTVCKQSTHRVSQTNLLK